MPIVDPYEQKKPTHGIVDPLEMTKGQRLDSAMVAEKEQNQARFQRNWPSIQEGIMAGIKTSPYKIAEEITGMLDTIDQYAINPGRTIAAGITGAPVERPMREISEYFRDLANQGTPEFGKGTPGYYAYAATSSILQNVPALVLGFGTKSKLLANLAMGAMTAEDKYNELKGAGFSESRARAASGLYGAAEMLGEKVPLDMLFKNKGIKAILLSSLTEIPGELATTIMQNGIDIGLLDQNMSFKEWKDSLLDTLIVTGIASPLTAGLGRGLGVGTQRVLESRQKRQPTIQVIDNLKPLPVENKSGAMPPDITLETKDGQKIVARQGIGGPVIGSYDGTKLNIVASQDKNRFQIANALIDTHKTLTEQLTQMESEAKLDLSDELHNQTQLAEDEASQREAEIRSGSQAGMAATLDQERSQEASKLNQSPTTKEPWQMTQKEYIDKHITGSIDTGTYDRYSTKQGVSWLGRPEQYPELLKEKVYDGEKIVFRQSGELLKYTKVDDQGEIVRDKQGLATYLSEQEMKDRGLNQKSETIVAFNENNEPIGWASNEFGADGVWIVDEYQKKGIGSDLYKEFRKQFKKTRKGGQATQAGINLSKSYHKSLVEDALAEGKQVPESVLKDYPDLTKQSYEDFISQVDKPILQALNEGDFETLTQYANNFPDAKSFAEALGEKPRKPSRIWADNGYKSAFDFYRQRRGTRTTLNTSNYEGFVNEDTGELIGEDYQTADSVSLDSLLKKLESMKAWYDANPIEKQKKKLVPYKLEYSIEKVKTVIRRRTGQTRIDNLVNEMDALEYAYKMAEKTSREAYDLGDKTGTLVEHSRMVEIQKLLRQKQAQNKEKKTLTRYIDAVTKKLDSTVIPDNYRDTIKAVISLDGSALEAFVNQVMASEQVLIIPEDMIETLKDTQRDGMTLDQLRNQKDIIKTLLFQGRAESRIEAFNKKLDLQELAVNVAQEIADAKEIQLDELLKRMNLTDLDKQKLLNPDTPSRLKQITEAVGNLGNYAKKVEYIVEKLIGFGNYAKSKLYNATFQKTVEAERVELTRGKMISDRLNEAVKLLEGNPIEDKIRIPGMATDITRQQAIMIALNSGATKNREGLKAGWGLTDDMINRIVLSLSENETKFVTQIWDLINDQFEAIDAEYLKLTGLHMKRVDGQYFPLKYDPKHPNSDFIAKAEAESDMFRMYSDINNVFRGFTVERTKGKPFAPLLDFSVIIRHLTDVNHFVAWGNTVKDINRVINNPVVKEAMIQSVGEGQYEQFKPWLKGIANTEHYDSMKGWDRLLTKLTNNSSVAILGYAFSTTVLQPTALTQAINFKYRAPDNSIRKLGVKNIMGAALDFVRNPQMVSDQINSMSIFMVDRTHNLDYNIRVAYEKEMEKLVKEKGILPFLKEHAFDFIVAADAITTKPVWWAAYNQAMKDSGDQKTAIDFADKVVRNTQGSGSQKDLSKMQHSGATWKALTMFQTFFNATYNEWGKSKDMVMQGEVSPLELAKTFFWITLIPALLSSIWKEREDILENPAGTAKEVVGYGFGSIPVVGNAVNAWLDNFDYRPSPVISAVSDLGKAGTSALSGNYETAIKKGASSVGTMFGIPGTRQAVKIGEAAWELIDEGETDPLNLVYKKRRQ